MPIDTLTDITACAMADFGEAQVWTPAGGAATPFTGVPESVDASITLVVGAVTSAKWSVWARSSAIGAAKARDGLTFTFADAGISAQACTVAEAQKDPADLGAGFTRLFLVKAS